MNLHMRAARSTDAGQLGEILGEAVAANHWKPQLHSAAQDVAHMGDLIDRGWVHLCERGDQVLGFIARNDTSVQSLYVRSTAQNEGVGAMLLNNAKTECDRLELWTFQANIGAQRFYVRHGFTEAERTNGAGNEEGLPDIRYVWAAPKGDSDNG